VLSDYNLLFFLSTGQFMARRQNALTNRRSSRWHQCSRVGPARDRAPERRHAASSRTGSRYVGFGNISPQEYSAIRR
jgi:hypothetical protein